MRKYFDRSLAVACAVLSASYPEAATAIFAEDSGLYSRFLISLSTL